MSARRRALVTGITGQDGSYLAELLISKGYDVHGMIRRSSTFNTARIDHIYQDPHDPGRRLFLHYGDLSDGSMLARLLAEIQPDEIYNLGAQSHVGVSFDMPVFTSNVTALGTLRLLESVRESRVRPRIYQASSSEMYGDTPPPQTEDSPLVPASPYAAAKVFGHHMAGIYRDAYGLHISRGILHNHESPRRGETFVTRKVTRAVAQIVAGKASKLYLGNLDARRDWGYAPEYVEAMWTMLQQDEPGDYVLATGESHTVADLCRHVFELVDLDWQEYVEIDPQYVRPKEVHHLCGLPARAKERLGWEARTRFAGLVQIMLQADLAEIELDPAAHIRRELLPGYPSWARRA